MGSCESSELRSQEIRSKAIDRQLKKVSPHLRQKLLLLGPGESGKSTCLKQMQLLHNHGFTEAELEEKKMIVYYNTMQNMVTLLEEMPKFHLQFEDPSLRLMAGMLKKHAQSTNETNAGFTDEIKTTIERLWADSGVQKCYARRSEFQFMESASYFFDEIDRIAAPDYRPTSQDILHTRVATTGVVQVNFNIKSIDFEVYDVGGQRSERRKWIHCFDDVNGLIFVVAISEYDQKIREDNLTNRLTEALELYDNVLNTPFFDKASMILFFNKKDLFAEKIQRVSLNVCFPHYKGGLVYDDGIKHIRKEFNKIRKKERNLERNPERKVYVHETCATDTDQVQVVINSVIDTIIQENLRDTGMI